MCGYDKVFLHKIIFNNRYFKIINSEIVILKCFNVVFAFEIATNLFI